MLTSFYTTFLCYNIEKKLFFAPENMKKTPSKVAHNRPRTFFHYCRMQAQLFKKRGHDCLYSMPRPFTGPKIFGAGPDFLGQTKN